MDELKTAPIKGFMAGFLIGVGCMVFLACDSKYIGALFFTVGLVTICNMGYLLITGRICSALERDRTELLILPICIVGNFLGCLAAGKIAGYALPKLCEKALTICTGKLAQAPMQTILLGVLCGLMMFAAVETFRKNEGFPRYLGILLAVPTFILAGFEHSVADTVYFFIADMPIGDWGVYIILVLLGNMVGGLAFPALTKLNSLFIKKKEAVAV